jgi:acyl-CoA thioesterase II
MTPPALQSLIDVLDLEYIEENIFRGTNRNLGSKRVFGGQVLAQALVAARRTVDAERMPHSLHAYFILPGDIEAPIVYDVDRIRDGGSFTTRRIRAIQHGQPIFNMSASFHRPEPGLEHQDEMPGDIPGPEELSDELDLIRAVADRFPDEVRDIVTQDRPFHFRQVDPVDLFKPQVRPPRNAVWFKTVARLADDPSIHQSLLAYASDHGLLPISLRPHGLSWFYPNMQVASLDHVLWFHRPFRVDEWLLYLTESPSASGARGFTRGSIYDQSGALVASVAQEGLIRKKNLEG